MTKYRIAWLPGDGCGVDVLKAAEIVLKKICLETEYVYGGKIFSVLPLPKSRQAIIDAGGLIPYTRSRLLQTAGSPS
jgi:hypothetical protein